MGDISRPSGSGNISAVLRRSSALLAALLLAAGLAACGGSSDGSSDASETSQETTTTTAPTTTTSVPPGGRQPTPEDPLRVVFAGDSIMGNLAPAAVAALNGGGAVEAKFVLAPSIARDATVQVLWQAQLDEFDPDLIVMLVGTWENAVEGGFPGVPGWREQYEPNVLDPFVELITSEGAQVIWIGMPPTSDVERSYQFAALNEVYAALAERYPDTVQFVDGAAAVSPNGQYVETIPTTEGGVIRLRRTDGTHLCPDGAVLIARPVLRTIQEDWNVPLMEGWESAEWRLPENVEKAYECPGI